MDSSRVLVLVHAFPLGARMWTEQRSAFPGWTVLAPSLPGFDGTPAGPGTMAAFAERVHDYLDEQGRSLKKFLLRKPIADGIMRSGFGNRNHPILRFAKMHTGVDWAAPIGTPIVAAGNGTVIKAARESGYGNRVEIQHANGYVTTYNHMTGFARGITEGVRVRQGQVVGFLGSTGLSTGPHLHYEVIVNGHFVDPMRVKLARTREIEGRMLVDFKRERDRIDGLMAKAPNNNAAKVAKTAHKNGTTLREEAVKDGIPGDDFDRIVRPEDMIGPK